MSFLARKIVRQIGTFVINEYRFYVDFKGMLYFEDTKEFTYPNSIKDKKFITQFYQNLVPTKSFLENKKLTVNQEPQTMKKIKSLQEQIKRNKDYPYMAEFWGQRNYLKYGISPIIFNRIISRANVPQLELSEEFRDSDLLEFSFGQYSLFDVNHISIDNQGKIWHPYIRLPKPKSKKILNTNQQTKNISKTNILGVFSNQLIAQMLDQIAYENGSAFLSFKGNKIRIPQKPSDQIDNQVSSKIF